MEDDVRFTYFSAIQTFADAQGLVVVWPHSQEDAETNGQEGGFTLADFENEELFLRPRITSLAPRDYGIKSGKADYRWLVQVSIYFAEGNGEMSAARMADLLRQTFIFNQSRTGPAGLYSYKQVENARVSFTVRTGKWTALPFIFTVSCIA